MVFFSDVSKKYEKTNTLALDRVSFYIEKGEFVFIIGSTGCGKSSLIKMLYREEKPTEGSIIVGGLDVAKIKNRKVYKLRRKLGVVFQDYHLFQADTFYTF